MHSEIPNHLEHHDQVQVRMNPEVVEHFEGF